MRTPLYDEELRSKIRSWNFILNWKSMTKLILVEDELEIAGLATFSCFEFIQSEHGICNEAENDCTDTA